jgi:hypothetical protein
MATLICDQHQTSRSINQELWNVHRAETADAFCDGHVAAFEIFGGVPKSILYDNIWTPPAQGDLLTSADVECTNLSGLLRDRSRPWP